MQKHWSSAKPNDYNFDGQNILKSLEHHLLQPLRSTKQKIPNRVVMVCMEDRRSLARGSFCQKHKEESKSIRNKYFWNSTNHENRNKSQAFECVREWDRLRKEIGVKHIIRLMNPKNYQLYLICKIKYLSVKNHQLYSIARRYIMSTICRRLNINENDNFSNYSTNKHISLHPFCIHWTPYIMLKYW